MLALITAVALAQQGGVVRKPLVAKPGPVVKVELSAAEMEALSKPAPTLPEVKRLTREEIRGPEPVVVDQPQEVEPRRPPSKDPEMDAAQDHDATCRVMRNIRAIGEIWSGPSRVELWCDAVERLLRRREVEALQQIAETGTKQAAAPAATEVELARLRLLEHAVRLLERQALSGQCADPRLILEALK
jgi:hypothetical protein